jgi:hypothetical protein
MSKHFEDMGDDEVQKVTCRASEFLKRLAGEEYIITGAFLWHIKTKNNIYICSASCIEGLSHVLKDFYTTCLPNSKRQPTIEELENYLNEDDYSLDDTCYDWDWGSDEYVIDLLEEIEENEEVKEEDHYTKAETVDGAKAFDILKGML